jgi:transcription initiation factor IIE alpha subunit
MDQIARLLGRGAEVIADFKQNKTQNSACTLESVLEMLNRRPCTREDLCAGLGADENAVQQILDKLMHIRQIESEKRGSGVFFKPVE